VRLDIQEKKLNEMLERIRKMDNDDDLKSHLSKYFCVLVSGYIENYLKDLISNYHTKTCKKETSKFVNIKVKTLTNLDDQKIIAFLESFSSDWSETYESSRSGEMEAAFNTVYAQRNKIAHGDATNSNISYTSISAYFTSIKEALTLLDIIVSK